MLGKPKSSLEVREALLLIKGRHSREGSCDKLNIGFFRQEACAGARAPRFRLWIQNRDGSGSSRFNFFTASGSSLGLVVVRVTHRQAAGEKNKSIVLVKVVFSERGLR